MCVIIYKGFWKWYFFVRHKSQCPQINIKLTLKIMTIEMINVPNTMFVAGDENCVYNIFYAKLQHNRSLMKTFTSKRRVIHSNSLDHIIGR